MTHHRLINTALVLAIATVLSTSYLLDGPDDTQAAWDQDLRTAAAGSARREAAAQRLCTQHRGPNAEARWTPEGDLVCTTRRGLKPLQLAQGGTL